MYAWYFPRGGTSLCNIALLFVLVFSMRNSALTLMTRSAIFAAGGWGAVHNMTLLPL
jgi:hypothetical protein